MPNEKKKKKYTSMTLYKLSKLHSYNFYCTNNNL